MVKVNVSKHFKYEARIYTKHILAYDQYYNIDHIYIIILAFTYFSKRHTKYK